VRNVRLALRYLLKSPGYTLTAVITLAVAIGANSAMFSAVYGVLLRPLPIADASRLIVVWDSDPSRSVPVIELSFRQFERWAAAPRVFEKAASFGASTWPILLEQNGETTRLALSGVSAGFFETFGTTAVLGRSIQPHDEAPGAPRVVVLSHSVWTRVFGADPAIIGKPMNLGETHTVVGVMPDGFDFPRGTDIWMPVVPILAASSAGWNTDALQDVGVLFVVGRLREGMTAATAAQDLGVVTAPNSPGRFGTRVVATPFVEQFFGPVRQALFALFAAVALLLLIACANVSGLMLARLSSRRTEDAVRLALGATRAVLGKQWALETVLLFAAACLLGLGLGQVLTKTIVALAPPDVPRLSNVTFSLPVALFTMGSAAITALLAVAVSIGHASSVSLTESLNTVRATRSRRTLRARSMLVVLQLAFSLALIVTAVLVVRSFVNLRGIDLGFVPDRVLTVGIEPRGVDPAKVNTWVRDLTARLEALPGVEAAGAVYLRPLALGPIGQETWVLLEGQSDDAETRQRSPTLNYQVATPGYFAAMRIPLAAGRMFTDQDRAGQPRVALVGVSAARRLWPGQDPIGKRVRLPSFIPGDRTPVWRTIVGVVADVRYRGLNDVRLDVYDAALQSATQATDVVVRTSADPARLVATVHAEVRQLDPRAVIDRVTTMQAIVDKETAPWRFSVWVLTLFGAIAFVLAGLGLFGLVSLDVAERDREFAIRLALGAQREDVIRAALSVAGWRVLAGLALGVGAAGAAARGIRALLFGVTPLDVTSFAAGIGLVLAVVTLASYLPARRAASIEPLVLLRRQ
jgi:putative ABC transport system permease protein